MIKCCIFDLDGTLLDTLATITYYVNKTFSEEKIAPITEEECKYFAGDGPKELISRAIMAKAPKMVGETMRILARYKENCKENPIHLTAPYEGVEELLDALVKRGIKVGVASNKQNEITVPICQHFFGDRVALARGSKDGVPLKPAPDIVVQMMRELGVDKNEVLYVGDTDVDMKTGKGVGAAETVGVSWGFRTERELVENGADVIVRHPCEILEVIQR